MRRGNDQHEKELRKYTEALEKEGYRVIDLAGKSPDGVAARIVDGKIEISAVEVLSSQYREGKGWSKKWTWKAKKQNYSMFDNVLIHVFKQLPNISKPTICEFKGCAKTDIADYQIIGATIVLCNTHIDLLIKADPDNRTEFIYWCTDHLNQGTTNRIKRGSKQ